MKQFASGMKRGFAMLMALVMVLTAMQSGLISLVHAEESYDETAHLNNIVVENYGGKLTQQMEIILSGLLEGDKTFQYNYPETGLIEVDSETKTITASVSKEGWVPVRANILVDDKSVETVVLTNGVGTYEYDGNAFSVVVTYHLYTEQFTEEEQLKLMNAAYYLMLDYKNIHSLRTGTVESVLKLLTDKQAALENIDGIELEDTTAIGLIYLLATEGIELPALEIGGEPWVLEFHRTSPSKQAAKDLFNDKEDDGVLALYKELNNKLSDLELLDKNSATLLEALVSNYEDIQTLATDDRGLQLVIDDLAAYIAEAETAIPEMKAQLNEYKALLQTLKDTEAQLADARTQLNEMKTLWTEYKAAKEQLTAARAELDALKAQWNAYKSAKAQVEEARTLLNQAKESVSAYETNKAKLDAELQEKFGTTDYATAKQIIAQLGHLDPENSQRALEAIEYVEGYADEYETAKAQIAENEPKLLEAEAQLTAAEKEIEGKLPAGVTLQNADQKLAETEAQLVQAEEQMAEAEKEIEKKLAEYGVTLATADEYLAQAETQLATAEKQLADAKAQADKELKKLGMSLATIDADLAAAEAKLAEAEAGLAQMGVVETAIKYLINQMKSFCTAAAPAYNCTEWHTLTKDLIKDGLNSEQYTKLTNMVAPLDIKAPFTDADVSTKLQINTYEVKYNMSMFNVDVYVKVFDLDGVMGSNNLGEPKIEHVQVTLVKGATKAQIEAAILAAGLNPGACPENHVPHTSTVLPDTLTGDFVHTVTYIPAEYTYTITDGGNEIAKQNVYHGYTMRLPAYTASNEKVYEYIVNGVTYAQNSVITITGNTSIQRVLGKPRTVVYLKHLVSDTMGGGLTVNGQYGLTADAAAILRSAALNTPTIAIRIPGTDVQPVISAGKVTAPKYSADFQGLYWEPAIAYFVDENGQTIAKEEMVNGSCDLISGDYAQIKVSYKLVVSEGFTQDQLRNMLNLPNTLVKEYKTQTAELKVLNDQYSALAQLNSQNMGMIMTAAKLIDDPVAKESITAILNEINANSMGTNGQLKLYNLLTGYNTEGIAYYYENYNAFTTEVAALTDYLTRLWADPVNKAALIKVMEDNAAMLGKTPAEMLEYIAPLDSLLNAMSGLTLTAPNAAIDTENEQLGALGAAIENAAKVPTFSGSVAHPVIYTVPSVSPSVVAPDKVSFNFTIYINGAKVVLDVPTSMTFRLDKATSTYTLTSADAKAIADMVTSAVRKAQEIAPLDAMYKCEAVGTLPKAGDVLTSSVELSYEYTAKTFTVYVEGTAEQTISHTTTMKVTLPAGNAYVRYEYIIGGKIVPAGTYTFTEEDIVLLFPYGTLTVERIETELDPVGDKLQSVVDSMNGGDVKVEMNSTKNDDGTYNYVLDMYIPTTVMSNPGVLADIGMGLIGGYQYIEINDEVLMDGKMYVQALINAVMDSGLGSQTIQNIAAKNGGKLMSAKLGLGATDVDVVATLNVHLVGDSAELDQIASLLSRFGSYVNIVCVDGGLQINLTLPEKAYQAYLAAMLMLDKRDLKNINDINAEVALGYILSVMDPVLTDENLTLDTFNNTLKKLGYNLDTEGLDQYFDRMVDAYNSIDWVYDEDGVATSITGRDSVINLIKGKLGVMGEMIADESISVSVALNVTNLAAEDYEAVYADISAAGITNKVGMTRDLSVKNFAGKAVIVLLSDVGSAQAPVSLTFADTTVLDLNGYTIYGDVKCTNGTLYIVDNSLDSVGTGGVTGKVSGNVVITSGTYSQDVSSMVKAGYSQVNGAVKNDYYTIVEDANGNYTITLNAAAVNPSNLPDIKALALDMLMDLALNGYNKGAMWINGYQVYDIALGNVVDAYSSSSKLDYLMDTVINGSANQAPWVNIADLAELYNLFVKDLTNFENLANGEYLAQYEVSTAPWEISVFVDGDHISAGVGALSSATKKHTVTIVLSDDATADSLKDLAGELDQIVDIYSDLEMSQNKVGNNIYINANYKESNLVIDLTTNAAKNRDYLIMIGTMLANVVDNNKALNEGLKILKATGSANALKAAIDKCTVSDLLTALADVDRNYDFSEFGELGETYGNVLKVLGAVIRKLDIADKGSRTLGSMNGTIYGTYVLDKENLSLNKTFSAGGYNLIVNAKAPLVSVTLKLCNECQHAAAQKVAYKAPTCTEDGNIEHYYCAECDSYFLDAYCTQAVLKKEVIIPAAGHSYDSVVTAPTCTEQGYTTHTCHCGDTYVDSYVEALGHNYKVEWKWAEGYTSATATFTCQNDNTHVHVLDATVVLTDDSYEATCEQAGKLTYIATVTFEGKDYTDTKILTPAATGHSYVSVVTPPTCTEQGYTTHTCHCGDSYIDSYVDPTGHSYQVEWNWADDYSSATATFTCGNGCNMIHDVLDAYVANNGKGVYIATVTYLGTVYVDIQAMEHTFTLARWEWAADYTYAIAVFTCDICGDEHTLTVAVPATCVSRTEATCVDNGLAVYAVALNFAGKIYTDEAQQILLATGKHNVVFVPEKEADCSNNGNIAHWYCAACGKYFADEACTEELASVAITGGHKYETVVVAPTCTEQGYTKHTCSVCGGYYVTDLQSATGHKHEAVVTPPTCTTAGYTTYTCSCGDSYIDPTSIVPATGHNYVQVGGFNWAEDCTSATVTIKCEGCGDEHTLDAAVKVIEHIEPSANGDGKTVYSATAVYNGQTFTETKTVNHKYRLEIISVDVGTNAEVVGSKVTEDGYIYLDVQPAGVNVDTLMNLLSVKYDADKLTLTLTNSKEGSGLICNGSELTITASNNDGASISKTYVIIVLGDANCNGRVEVADIALIAATRAGTSTVELSKAAVLASDLNGNGGLDVGDVAKNANKVAYWDSYKSQL